MKKILASLLFLLLSFNLNAMVFGQHEGRLYMSGEIESGDFVRFLNTLLTFEGSLLGFYIQSEGGDLDEAMNIGRLVRQSQIPIWSGDHCYSACVFIYVAGVERIAGGDLGLHRPYFDKGYFSDLTSLQAEMKYSELKQASAEYLKDMEVPQNLIERIFKTSSTEVDLISAVEANDLFGKRSNFYGEWVKAKCGSYTEAQSVFISSWFALSEARELIESMADGSLHRSEGVEKYVNDLLVEAKLAHELEKKGMLQRYKDIYQKKEQCASDLAKTNGTKFKNIIRDATKDLASK
jgi:hypothetical protein|tara:strand:+ start:3611 stop:4489 length:879 start_codon:yes stop_codon:yes gene_type:complete